MHIASSDHDRGCGPSDGTTCASLTKADLDELEPTCALVIGAFQLRRVHRQQPGARRARHHVIDPRIRPVGTSDTTRTVSSTAGYRTSWGEAHAHSVRVLWRPDRWADLIVERCNVLRTEGITAVHDPACAPSAAAVYRMLARDGRLPISILAMSHPKASWAIRCCPVGRPIDWRGRSIAGASVLASSADRGSHPNIDGHIDGNHVQFGFGFDTSGRRYRPVDE